jgi:hypothetical protein
LGVLIVLASGLLIAFLLAVALGPLVARLIGVNTVALSADETAVRFITLTGIGGGAGFIGGIWLMVGSRARSKSPTQTQTKVD